jgi:hypothetical protein
MGNSSSKPKEKQFFRGREIEEELRRIQAEQAAIVKARMALQPKEPSPGPGPPDGFTGEHVYGNGDRAKGEFRGGKLNGRGEFYSNDKYESGWRTGMFVNNKLHGLGRSYWTEDKLGWNSGQFEHGDFRSGRRHYPPKCDIEYHEGAFWGRSASGWGTRVWRNGDRFVGHFYDDEIKDGQSGIFTWANGESFRGKYYYKGKKHGRARYDAQGHLMDGSYWNDEWFPGNEIAKVAPTPYQSPESDDTKRARIAAGWGQMQANPVNNWVAGGVWNS